MNSCLRSKKGFTLLEFVVVVALAAVLIGLTAILLTKARGAANFSTTQERIRIISTGLSEHTMFRNSLPAQTNMSATWPETLSTYIEAEFRAGGELAHGYQCDTTTNNVVLRTPAFESQDAAEAIRVRLVDQNICTEASVVADDNRIDCVLRAFADNARCR